MRYGNLRPERVQPFASLYDPSAGCTIDEREEFELHIACGDRGFAVVDYAALLQGAEVAAHVIVWDDGSNFRFIRPYLHIDVAGPLRPDQAATHHRARTLLMAHILVVNKADAAPASDVEALVAGLRAINPRAAIVRSFCQYSDHSHALVSRHRAAGSPTVASTAPVASVEAAF